MRMRNLGNYFLFLLTTLDTEYQSIPPPLSKKFLFVEGRPVVFLDIDRPFCGIYKLSMIYKISTDKHGPSTTFIVMCLLRDKSSPFNGEVNIEYHPVAGDHIYLRV
ncbi:unnamed protein product [Amoebophrya sp. A25]|nr:unnamed protein product [Amoebophrya sp. A25]|eukprot:GSA25T00009135001.1